MCQVAGELADGVHVHPMHSVSYIHNRLLPNIRKGAERAGRSDADVDLTVPVFAIPGDTAEEREALLQRTKIQLAFYGSTPNYAFQFDDLGFTGTTAKLGKLMKEGDLGGVSAVITDEMIDHFAVIARWDDLADKLMERYGSVASRVVMYLASESIHRDPASLSKWGEVARAVSAD